MDYCRVEHMTPVATVWEGSDTQTDGSPRETGDADYLGGDETEHGTQRHLRRDACSKQVAVQLHVGI